MVEIRLMSATDVSAVKVIEDELFPVDAWSESLFLGELAEQSVSREVAVALIADVVVGYASFRYVGKQGDINTVAVSIDQQGKGIGTALMDWLEEQATKHNVREIFLEVRSDNEPAIAMYRARDYERIDIRRNYYGSAIDAFIMRKKVTNV